jgi:starch-binding outer membrane protein, SusD/RagB family
MPRILRIAGAVGAMVALTACNDFLTGDELTTDPNRPSEASITQLLTAVQVQEFIQHTGALARLHSMWTQQMSGTDRQYIQQALYQITEDDFSNEWNGFYGGGGLQDMRLIQERATEANDLIFRGIAKVWEAFAMGTATSIWGDIPYSEAVAGVDNPKLDAQADIYAALQTLLDEAIADLSSGTGVGPGSIDMIYGGDTALWINLAHTLKARFYLHTAEQNPGAYAQALAEAQLGIADSTGDMKTLHTDAATENNIWHQFFRDRDSYMRAGKTLVDTMLARNDPRLPNYFSRNQQGQFVGAAEGEPQAAKHSTLSVLRLSPSYSQPLVTWAENQLIIAEAAYKTGNTGLATSALNLVRQGVGLGPVSASGSALLHAIMIEKWITLFQNIEALNDYRRTCSPNLVPAGGASTIPGRIFYAFSERNTNPNIPAPEAQDERNPLDPANALSANGQACIGS